MFVSFHLALHCAATRGYTSCIQMLVEQCGCAIQGGNGGFRILGFFWDFGISFGFSDFENPKIQSGYPLADNEISN